MERGTNGGDVQGPRALLVIRVDIFVTCLRLLSQTLPFHVGNVKVVNVCFNNVRGWAVCSDCLTRCEGYVIFAVICRLSQFV